MHLLIKQEIANLTIQDVKNILYGVRGGWGDRVGGYWHGG